MNETMLLLPLVLLSIAVMFYKLFKDGDDNDENKNKE